MTIIRKLSPKYVTVGLRRDKNLSDVVDKTAALDNLLNNLVNSNNTAESFISADLDALRGLHNFPITADKLTKLANITVNYTQQITNPSTGLTQVVDTVVTPLLTLQDRINNAKIITGDIPGILGGDGLLARFVPSSAVNTGTSTSTGATIFTTSTTQLQEVFWDIGWFTFPTFLDNSFTDQYGGVQWTGWFAPEPKDPAPTISVMTTGLTMFEVDPAEDGNWQTLLSFYAATRVLDVTTGSGTTTITVTTATAKFAGIGDFITTNSSTSVIGITGNVLTLSDVHNGTTISLSKEIGKTKTNNSITLPIVEVGNQLKIRLSYWNPSNVESIPEKIVNFTYIGGSLPFYNLYSVKPSATLGQGEIRQVLKDVVTPAQPAVGQSGDNKQLFVNNSLISNYYPKSGFTEILKLGPVTVSCTSTNNLITSSTDISGVEIGSVIVPASTRIITKINKTIQVTDSYGYSGATASKILSSNIGSTTTELVNFIDYRGFIGWYYATSAGTTVTLPAANVNNIRPNYVVVTPTSTPTSWFYVVSTSSSNTFITNTPIGLSGEEIIYIYSDRGLVDTSKDDFCRNVFGQVLSVSAALGATSLTLSSITGVVIGQVIQYSGSIAEGTTVSDLPGGNVITISVGLTESINASSTIVFAPAGTSLNKEGCVIPLDTAPPFIGVPTGLSSNGKGLASSSTVATFTVVANKFSANVVTSTDIVSVSGTLNYDKLVPVNSNGVTYSILGSST